jgi:hypothetical protein
MFVPNERHNEVMNYYLLALQSTSEKLKNK